MFDFTRERQHADAALAQLGFVLVLADDPSTRPPTLAWHAGQWQGRRASATVIGNRVRSIAAVMGNRTKTVPCLQLIVEASVADPLGCGLSLPFGERAPSSLDVPDSEPLDVAAGLNLASWMAWSLETGREAPGERSRDQVRSLNPLSSCRQR